MCQSLSSFLLDSIFFHQCAFNGVSQQHSFNSVSGFVVGRMLRTRSVLEWNGTSVSDPKVQESLWVPTYPPTCLLAYRSMDPHVRLPALSARSLSSDPRFARILIARARFEIAPTLKSQLGYAWHCYVLLRVLCGWGRQNQRGVTVRGPLRCHPAVPHPSQWTVLPSGEERVASGRRGAHSTARYGAHCQRRVSTKCGPDDQTIIATPPHKEMALCAICAKYMCTCVVGRWPTERFCVNSLDAQGPHLRARGATVRYPYRHELQAD